YGKELNFQQTHTPRNVSVALLLQGGIGRYMYASAYNYTDVFVGPTYSMGYSDTITLPLLSTDMLDAFSVGSEYTRVEKTLRVADIIADSYSSLNICVRTDNAMNCSMCSKCMRTLLVLDIAGLLDRYSTSFDLNTYAKHKNWFIGRKMGSHDPLPSEIFQFAKRCNYSFSFLSHLYAMLAIPVHLVKNRKYSKSILPVTQHY
ncbi:MAG: hypothetical protein KAI70_04005, partial [Candidatus Omnitrophica bacterium]|nr:hypothetical protein [Candidatus Omnitrophota bacterium]